ncbi:MAG: SIR2 family protein [Candidatus Zixiibacteriota bacterium]
MRLDKQIRLAFLLGSGISIPAGMPSTRDITKQVLSGEGIRRNNDETYCFGAPLYAYVGIPDEYVPRIVIFLNRLKIEIDLYYLYQIGRFLNYEDLYYVVGQIHDSELRDYDNPAVQPFIDKILPDIRHLLKKRKNEYKLAWRLHELAGEAMNYIVDIVWHMLNKEPSQVDHLNSLREACIDSQVTHVDIFTLNHDTVIERCFSQNGVRVTDGFDEPLNEVRYWNPGKFEDNSSKVRLFKLHGSLNWFWFRSLNGNSYNVILGIPLGRDIQHTNDPQGKMQILHDGRPLLLAGTFNKMLRYTSGIYAHLHYQFFRSLYKNQRLVVCGYSFSDRGINNHIVDWMYSSSDHRIVIIHPEPEKLKSPSRISKYWDEWTQQNRLIIIPKPIEKTSWDDIKNNAYT